jgi:hypothetical protein
MSAAILFWSCANGTGAELVGPLDFMGADELTCRRDLARLFWNQTWVTEITITIKIVCSDFSSFQFSLTLLPQQGNLS